MPLARTPSVDVRALAFVQRALPGAVSLTGASALSRVGEHGLGWLVICATGAIVDSDRRTSWIRASGPVVVAHASAVVLKRIVRRARPSAKQVLVYGIPASSLSFPSAHASSTAAAAIAFQPLLGRKVLAMPVLMGLARMRLGLHYPSDVAAGWLVGLTVARSLREPP